MSARALRGLVVGASVVQIGFGVWHFFVPALWSWYDAIAPGATELVLAVRATNFFFSLCLVLMGAQSLLLGVREPLGSVPLRVVLGAATVLWLARVMMQLVAPQGSISPVLQYGMLTCFVCVAGAYGVALGVASRVAHGVQPVEVDPTRWRSLGD